MIVRRAHGAGGPGWGTAARRIGALVALALCAGAGRVSAQAPAGFDEGVVEVRVALLPPVTQTALINARGGMLIPIDPVLQTTGLPVQRADSTWSIPAIGGSGVIVLDARRRVIRRAGDSISVATDEIAWYNGQLFLETSRVGSLLQAEVVVDMSSLTVNIRRATPFPAEQQTGIVARRAAARRRQEIVRAGRPVFVPYRARSGGFVLDWGLSSSSTDFVGGLAGEARLGAAIAGGELRVGGSFYNTSDASGAQITPDWYFRRGFPTSGLIRQIELGTVISGGAELHSFRGFAVSNRPFLRDQLFADLPINAQVPAGWQYEVYQDGQLIGYADAGARTPVLVPVHYGNTPVQVRLVGPAGEEVLRSLSFRIPPSQLPPGRFEYAFGGGACAPDECRQRGFVHAAWGATSWATLAIGADGLQDTSMTRVDPELTASLASPGGWYSNLQHVQHRFTHGLLAYYGESSLNGELVGGLERPRAGGVSLIDTTRSRWFAETRANLRPLGASSPRRLWLRFQARGEGEQGAGPERWRAAVYADMARTSFGIAHEVDVTQTSAVTTLSALLVTPSTRGPRSARGTGVTSSLSFDADGYYATELSTAIRAWRGGSVSVTARHARPTGPQVALGYVLPLGFARATSRVSAMRTQGLVGTLSLNGSAILDRRVGVDASDQGGTGFAGIDGTVFYDNDGDGRLSKGDLRASKVGVLVAGHRATTDGKGEFSTWNVPPYEIVSVTVDTLRGIDPSWVPLRQNQYLRTTPNRYNRADFALVRTREVTGAIKAAKGAFVPTAGVAVEIVARALIGDSAGARVTRIDTVRTFSDGTYYVSRMRPGRYVVRVAGASLEALKSRAVPESLTFDASMSSGDLIELPDMMIEPIQIAEIAAKDEDQDGVFDEFDRCPGTPPNTKVDRNGCPYPILFKPGVKVITLPGVTFELNRAVLRPSSLATLDTVVSGLLGDTTLRVEVAGHTDSTGSVRRNVELSLQRAEAVRDYLEAHGIRWERMLARGYGPSQPVAPNATEADRARNRRTELRLLADTVVVPPKPVVAPTRAVRPRPVRPRSTRPAPSVRTPARTPTTTPRNRPGTVRPRP